MPRKQKIDFNRLDIEYQKLVETCEYRSINDAARALNTSKSTIKNSFELLKRFEDGIREIETE